MNSALPPHELRLDWLRRQLRPWLVVALFAIVAFEFLPMPRAVAQQLRFYLSKARFILCACCVIAAAERVTQPNPHRRAPRRLKRRAIVGSRFRRALKAETPREEIQMLLALIDTPEFGVGYFMRRFRRGFTRWRTQSAAVALVTFPSGAPCVVSAAPPFT